MSNTFHYINVCSCPLTVCQVDYLASIRVYILDEIRFVKIPPLYGLLYIYIFSKEHISSYFCFKITYF